ncbi:MAG: zinc/iron-chelating domain-containing protein [Moraxellaceae bacterium]|nr:MAG: zinc/iron-chelating domain-containing protein [Moraxellaceae bacterium]
MNIEVENVVDPTVTCDSCQACCCRLEVMLITETGVPEHFVDIDAWGGRVMARLDDGWCAALDRDTFKCRIYNNRPLNCRVFEMGSYECIEERSDFS